MYQIYQLCLLVRADQNQRSVSSLERQPFYVSETPWKLGFGSWQLMDCHRELVQQDFLIFRVYGSVVFLNGVLVQSASRTCSSSQFSQLWSWRALDLTVHVRIQYAQQFNTHLTTLSAFLQSPQHRPRWWFSLVCCVSLLWLSLVCCVTLRWFSLVCCGTFSRRLLSDTDVCLDRLLVL